jgi:hypothetical protein
MSAAVSAFKTERGYDWSDLDPLIVKAALRLKCVGFDIAICL